MAAIKDAVIDGTYTQTNVTTEKCTECDGRGSKFHPEQSIEIDETIIELHEHYKECVHCSGWGVRRTDWAKQIYDKQESKPVKSTWKRKGITRSAWQY